MPLPAQQPPALRWIAAEHTVLKNFREIRDEAGNLCSCDSARLGNLKMGRTYQIEPDSTCDPAGLL